MTAQASPPATEFASIAWRGRTVRVELSSGDRKVNASVDARDESRLLQLLDAARARTA